MAVANFIILLISSFVLVKNASKLVGKNVCYGKPSGRIVDG